MTPSRCLFWHRRDLRLADNLGLAAAAAHTPALLGVVVLDPLELRAEDQAPSRLWFRRQSLLELAQAWHQAGSRLLVLQGAPERLLPELAALIGADRVVWNRDVEPAVRAQDRQVAAALKACGCKVEADWDQLLVPPELLRTGGGDPYRVYGPYWRRWRAVVEQRSAGAGLEPLAAPQGLIDPFAEALQADGAQERWRALAPLEDPLGSGPLAQPFEGAELCPCRPGERAAAEQLARFCGSLTAGSGSGRAAALLRYEDGRNLPAEAGTSALSAALRFGTLSPRQAWAAAQQARELARSAEELASITVWEQELAWREFYQQALFHFPELAEGPYRPQWRHFPWDNDAGAFEAWSEGLTGMPIVDAAMRQLRASGWMHNRCRMIVASFLVKDLICDWRWGERLFMQHLVDGDLAANNGGWQWSASSGMDPRPLRIFNPATQASKFDPEASYIRTWLPEIAHVATSDLISGQIGALERRGYPEPLVDHRRQQARFKALYAALRAES